MPYLSCPKCRLVTYSAAKLTYYGECPRCAARLGEQPARFFRKGLPTRLESPSGKKGMSDPGSAAAREER